ncbi:MAG: MXAN_2562 family outer membrane beta-barrel protein [Myxococcota bacterium]
MRLAYPRSLATACLVAAALPAPALAQIGLTLPVIVPSPIPAAFELINIDTFNADENITLTWSARVGLTEAYDFELTWDNDVLSATPNPPAIPVVLDLVSTDLQHGTVASGATYSFTVRPDQVVPQASWPGQPNAADNAERRLVISVYARSHKTDANRVAAAAYTWIFKYDTRGPSAPEITAIVPGEKRLLVEWVDTTTTTANDINGYEVLWIPAVTATTSSNPDVSEYQKSATVGLTQTSFGLSDGLVNGVDALVAVRGIDNYGNKGPLSQARIGRPEEVSDFFELYKGQNGAEKGGFCFIATAAYGSYDAPIVRVFRAFRDGVLTPSPIGAALVWLYYRWSPPHAAIIAEQPALAGLAKSALIPVALAVVALFALTVFAAAMLLRAAWRRSSKAAPALVVLAVLAGVSAPAHAERPKPTGAFGLGFEVKGGPYIPDMAKDDASGAGDAAFRQVFGKNGGSVSPNPLFSVGLDLQLFRKVGTAGVGFGFGFMQFVGRGYFKTSGTRSLDTSVLNLAPLELTLFYRFDWLSDKTGIPLVPYARGGLVYDLWWVTNGTGDIARVTGATAADDVIARGGKFGATGKVGVAILLNFLEPEAARNLNETTGIRGTYVFGELSVSSVNGFGGSGFDFSDRTWSVGVYLER